VRCGGRAAAPGMVLAETLTSHLPREIVARGSRDSASGDLRASINAVGPPYIKDNGRVPLGKGSMTCSACSGWTRLPLAC
jgi:hypothetical protein